MAEEPAVERIRGRYTVLAASIPAIIALAGAYLLGQRQGDTSMELPKSPAIKRTQPEGPTIREKTRLEGAVSELRAGESVWTFDTFQQDPDKVYPLGLCPVKERRWICDEVSIGPPVDRSKHIVWAAVLTDVQAARAVQALRRKDAPYMLESAREPQHADGEGAIDHKPFLRVVPRRPS